MGSKEVVICRIYSASTITKKGFCVAKKSAAIQNCETI